MFQIWVFCYSKQSQTINANIQTILQILFSLSEIHVILHQSTLSLQSLERSCFRAPRVVKYITGKSRYSYIWDTSVVKNLSFVVRIAHIGQNLRVTSWDMWRENILLAEILVNNSGDKKFFSFLFHCTAYLMLVSCSFITENGKHTFCGGIIYPNSSLKKNYLFMKYTLCSWFIYEIWYHSYVHISILVSSRYSRNYLGYVGSTSDGDEGMKMESTRRFDLDQ